MFPAHEMPLFRVFIGLTVGIILANFCPGFFNPQFILWIIFLLFAFLLYAGHSCSNQQLNFFGIVIIIVWILTGIYIISISLPKHISHHFSHVDGSQKLAIKLNTCEIKTKSTQCQAKVLFVQKDDQTWIKTAGKILVYLPKINTNTSFDEHQLILSPPTYYEIPAPKNPLVFSFQDFMAKQSIYHQIFLKPSEFLKIKNTYVNKKSVAKKFATAQSFFAKKLKRHLSKGSHQQIAMALSLGYKDELAKNTRSLFADTGAMHILAVSGLHVGMICLLFLGFFRLFSLPENCKILLVLISIWSYAFLTGSSASVIRACIMLSPILIAQSLFISHRHNSFNALALAGIVILLFDPNSIFQVSFQFSFLAVGGILLLYRKLNQLWNPRNKLIRYFWDLSCVSLSAQIALFPLSVYYFHQFPVYFLLSNFVAIPAAFLILIFSIILLLFDWTAPEITHMIQFLLTETLNILVSVLNFINKLPYAKLDKLWMSEFELFIWYGVLLLSLGYIFHKNKNLLVVTFFFMLILMLQRTHITAVQASQKKIIVYHHRKGFQVDFLIGTACFRWTHGLSNKSQSYASENFLTSKGVKILDEVQENRLVPILQMRDAKTVVFYNQKIKVLESDRDLAIKKDPKTSIALLHNNPKLKLRDVSLAFPNAQIIALANNHNYSLKKWYNQEAQQEIQLYSCNTDGAFIYNIK